MSSIEETAYPRLREEVSDKELAELYTPSAQERSFANATYRRPMPRVCLVLQIKLVQRLGYSVALTSVPLAIVAHVSRQLRVRRPTKEALQAHDASGEKSRHFKHVLKLLGLKELDAAGHAWLRHRAVNAARTKQELPDIINVLLEELVRQRYVLPGFEILLRIARSAREQVNSGIFEKASGALGPPVRARLDALLQVHDGKSDWDRLKREPKRPTTREVVSFLQHIRWLGGHATGLPGFHDVAATKLAQLTLEARALDAAEMRSLPGPKRYTLAALLIRSQLRKATDDVAEIFVKTLREMDTKADERLKAYHLEHTRQVERLIGQFRDVLTAYQQDEPERDRLEHIGKALRDDPEQLIAECDEHMAYADGNYFPFMLQPYRVKRALLFECLTVLQPMPTYQDTSFGRALAWLLAHRNSHKEYLVIDRETLDLNWLPEKWRRLILGKEESDGSQLTIHRKYLELCVLQRVREELQSGDLYVPNSEQYDDYRDHFVDEATFEAELPRYTEEVGLDADPDTFATGLQNLLTATAEATDREFPSNDSVAWGPNGLVLRKTERSEPPEGFAALDEVINDRMPSRNVLEVLIEVERWLDLHKQFGPLSGYQSKLDDRRARTVTTLFCYGFNMGPTQTSRSLKGFSRKQVAWLNLHHITEERLDKAIVKVINAYNRFSLPSFWGTGKSASADGTKWSVYEQNLMSEYHIRYGGYGGIGYYHVSDKYIALFSHFIPCGVYEAVYILDGLIRNESDIQPDTLHGDTQAQNTPVFALAYLLGIQLMPRIRNIKSLVFYRPSRDARYQNIQPLFRGEVIDWDLIKRHYHDMLRVAISIKAGKITPSTLLRRLGSASRKNKLYFAFRELGRVIRTIFLLRYIGDPQLRRTIHAATNKSEEFNGFAKWTFFGGEGIIAENVRHEQRKIVKYNHLVTNMILLHNVHGMSKVLKEVQADGDHTIDERMLGAMSPFRNQHLNRFGDYLMDLDRPVEPMGFRTKFF